MNGGEHEGEGGFEAGHTEGNGSAALFVEGVGGVVGGDHVYDVEVGPEGVAVGGALEGWAHDAHAFEAGDIEFGEVEVVGSYFAGDGQAALFGIAN